MQLVAGRGAAPPARPGPGFPELLIELTLSLAERYRDADGDGGVQVATAMPAVPGQATAADREHRTGLGAWRHADLDVSVHPVNPCRGAQHRVCHRDAQVVP
ncbi:MAG TPA: hypothetical protein VKU39_01570 [Streptosporangiaceae bacterium]|nr:hypothetical protein [Streptosporangiaceae bacterium]